MMAPQNLSKRNVPSRFGQPHLSCCSTQNGSRNDDNSVEGVDIQLFSSAPLNPQTPGEKFKQAQGPEY